jgi:hypothetical protein
MSTIKIRRLLKVPEFFDLKSKEHQKIYTIKHHDVHFKLYYELMDQLSYITKKVKEILKSYKNDALCYNSLYYKIDYDKNNDLLTSTLVLYHQTQNNYIDEVKNGLESLKGSDSETIQQYLYQSTNLF